MSKFFSKKTILVFLSVLLISCGDPLANLPGGSRDTPVRGKDRALKNLKEGKGMTLGKALGDRKTTYEFSSSNPMWRATFDVIDFMPLVTVDYSGGIIITDWYSEDGNSESVKLTIRFLSNEIRSDSLKIIVHKKICDAKSNCQTVISDSNLIKNELRSTILRKAALLEKSDETVVSNITIEPQVLSISVNGFSARAPPKS